MPDVELDHEADFAGWRKHARELAARHTRPERVVWTVHGSNSDLFERPFDDAGPAAKGQSPLRVPKSFLGLSRDVICHSDPVRFSLLYRLLFRLTHGEPELMKIPTDRDLNNAEILSKSVHRDMHKMKAFVRFREVPGDDPEEPSYVAWFEPTHYTLEATAPFFTRRFTGMKWSILTPYRSAHWDGGKLGFAGGADRSAVPSEDALEDYWRTYFASIFNPARLKIGAMQSEMPKKYWKNMPETRLIPELIRTSPARAQEMIDRMPQAPSKRRAVGPEETAMPEDATSYDAALRQAKECRACHLWEPATQTVFGEGPIDARVLMVGEQPGDQEDLQGRPFVGPAGQLFDRALAEAKIDRNRIYVTNAVKHFKFSPRGKRRIHQKPNVGEVEHCKWWLTKELEFVQPELIVALGATAALSLFGKTMAIGKNRGQPIASPFGPVLITVHPSYLLRLPDEDAKAREYQRFVEELASLKHVLEAA